MENPTPNIQPSNPHTQILLHNSSNHVNQTTQKNAMENFQEFILKLAETHPNKPLTTAAKTLLHGRLNRFVSEYKTPDHPPYSAMIHRALEDLNEKRGSTKESILQHLVERYDKLPWSYSVLLNQHLQTLCESGEVIMTRDNRYGFPGFLNLSKVGTRKQGRKWRYDWERERNQRGKQKLSRKRNKKNHEKDEVTEINQQSVEKEQRLIENGEHKDKSLFCVEEKGYSEEIGPSETKKADIRVVQKQGRQRSRPEILSTPNMLHARTDSPNTFFALTKQEDAFQGKQLRRSLRQRLAKTEISKDANVVSCTDASQHLPPKCRRLRVLLKPKPDSVDVEDLGPKMIREDE